MKLKALLPATTLLLVALFSTASAQQRFAVEVPGDPVHREADLNTFVAEHFTSKSTLATAKFARAGYCPTQSNRDVWDDAAWQNFSQTLTSCDNNGNSVDTEGGLYLTETWTPSYRWLRTYSPDNKITEWIHQSHNGTEFVNTRRNVNTYHSSGQLEVLLDQLWDGSTWMNEDRRTYEFNNEDVRIASLDEEWDATEWLPIERETSEQVDANTATELTEEWDGTTWQPTEMTTSEFTDDTNYSLTLQDWDGARWVNTRRLTSTDTDRTEEEWVGAQWVFQVRQTLTYDGLNRLTELREENWDGAQWVSDYRAVYVFDSSSGLRTEFLLDSWDGTAWANDHRQVYTHDLDGNQIEDLTLEWDGTEWINLLRSTTTWQEVGGVGIDEGHAVADGFRLLQNFPNPATGLSTIGFELPKSAEITLNAFDILGREAAVFFTGTLAAGTHELEVDLHALTSGTYFYQLKSGSTAVKRTMIIID